MGWVVLEDMSSDSVAYAGCTSGNNIALDGDIKWLLRTSARVSLSTFPLRFGMSVLRSNLLPRDEMYHCV